MRIAPDLPEDALAATLTCQWGIPPASLTYLPVGYGSHHWELVDSAHTRWFVTVDDLATRRHYRDEPLAAGYRRLRASLATATALRAHGREFVVAPVTTPAGEPVVPLGERLAVAVYPFVEGQSFGPEGFASAAHRRGVCDLVESVHNAPESVRRLAIADDFTIARRDELLPTASSLPAGPYARRAAELIADHAAAIRGLLDHYDQLVSQVRDQPYRAVLTHGEPHPANTMLASGSWRLIDWDTVRVAPPERDLWHLDPGDGSILRDYAAATGGSLLPAALELYRVGWDLTDLAAEVSRFRRPHSGSPEDDLAWRLLYDLVNRIG